MTKSRKSKIVALVALLALAALPSFAGTTDTLIITGKVTAFYDIAITPEAVASDLDLTSDQSAGLKIATVTEKSNNKLGFKVVLNSSNAVGDSLANFDSVSTTDVLDYTLTYGGETVTFDASGNAAFTLGRTAKTDIDGNDVDLLIFYDGTAVILDSAVDYTDTLLFTISAP